MLKVLDGTGQEGTSNFNASTHGDSRRGAIDVALMALDQQSAFELVSLMTVFETSNEIRQLRTFELIDLKSSATDHTDASPFDFIFVIAGARPSEPCARFHGWLRKQWRHGATICGVGGGAFVIACAGLLEGRRCTAHWEQLSELSAGFRFSEVSNRVIEQDDRIFTCSGGAGSIDLALKIVEMAIDSETANRVAERMVYQRRGVLSQQTSPIASRVGSSDDRLISVVELMLSNLEEPVSWDRIAEVTNISIRQIERIFKRELGVTIGDYYLRLRLEHAYTLLETTSMSIISVAVACGFVSASHFSTRFRDYFSCSPRELRNRINGDMVRDQCGASDEIAHGLMPYEPIAKSA